MRIKTLFCRVIMTCWKINPLKKQIALLIRFSKLPVNKLYYDLRFRGKFSVQIEDKKISLYSYYSTIENEIFWRGIGNGWEKISLKYWSLLCKNASVILDIGANTGVYALLAKK